MLPSSMKKNWDLEIWDNLPSVTDRIHDSPVLRIQVQRLSLHLE